VKKFYKLEDIANFENINNYFAAVGTPTFSVDAQQINLWSESQFESIFDENTEKSFYCKETNDPWGAFKIEYTQWLGRNNSFIAIELSALLSKYNPIYNYDRHEVSSGSDTELQTPDEWKDTKVITPDNWKSTTTQTPTNWKSTETQTPTNWQDQNVKSFTDYHETETQTPTDWTEETEKSFDQYHETETQTPTNWEQTVTQTPTQWQKTSTDSFTNYNETETERPTNWEKSTQTQGASGSNAEATENKIIPFDGSDWANVSKSVTQRDQNVKETQSGTFAHEKTISGTKENTEVQTGTYQTTTEQDGTFETDRTKTGTETDTKTQSGTYETDRIKTGTETDTRTQTGTYKTETEQTGTYKTETAETGTKTETSEKSGTFESKTTYGKKLDISGNIGVLSTEDMIRQVIELYDTDFIKRWIVRFIDSVCVYV
jgi:hypothetical protein